MLFIKSKLWKIRQYNKQVKVIQEYAAIISKHTGMIKDIEEVQEAAKEIYLKSHGKLIYLTP